MTRCVVDKKLGRVGFPFIQLSALVMDALRLELLDRWCRTDWDVVLFVVQDKKEGLLSYIHQNCQWKKDIYYYQGSEFADMYYTEQNWVMMDEDDTVNTIMVEHFYRMHCKIMVGMTADPDPIDIHPSVEMDVVHIAGGQIVPNKCWKRKKDKTLPDIASIRTPYPSGVAYYDVGVEEFVGYAGASYLPSIENVRPSFFLPGTNIFFLCDDRQPASGQECKDRIYVIDRKLDEVKGLNRQRRNFRLKHMMGEDKVTDIPLAYTYEHAAQAATLQHTWKSMPGFGPDLTDCLTRERRRQDSNRLLWETIAQCLQPQWFGPGKARRMVIHPFYTIYLISGKDLMRIRTTLEHILQSTGGFKCMDWPTCRMVQYSVVIPDDMRLAEVIQPPREWLMANVSERSMFDGDHRKLAKGVKKFTNKQRKTYHRMLTRLSQLYPRDITLTKWDLLKELETKYGRLPPPRTMIVNRPNFKDWTIDYDHDNTHW